VRQILLNLLTNAIKFTPEEGSITLSAKASKKSISLSVIDTGRGIPKDSIAELTKPFTRAEQDPHKAVEGWGLGLAISKSLVELHNGALAIKSQVDKGTTVTVTFPNVM
jgi:two-component system, cell cycle sensor histidine kinase PleC